MNLEIKGNDSESHNALVDSYESDIRPQNLQSNVIDSDSGNEFEIMWIENTIMSTRHITI